jgi:hypothetical protein
VGVCFAKGNNMSKNTIKFSSDNGNAYIKRLEDFSYIKVNHTSSYDNNYVGRHLNSDTMAILSYSRNEEDVCSIGFSEEQLFFLKKVLDKMLSEHKCYKFEEKEGELYCMACGNVRVVPTEE